MTQLTVVLIVALSALGRPQPSTLVVFETEKGAIEIAVDTEHAPRHRRQLPQVCRWRSSTTAATINRAVRPDNTVRHDVEIQVIQFQIDRARRREQFPPIPLERTSVTGLKHFDGAVSMARTGPDTATASFSIVIGDQPEMDFGGRRNPDGQGFAVFGRVVEGWTSSRRSRRRRLGTRGPYGPECLDPPIRILKAYRR